MAFKRRHSRCSISNRRAVFGRKALSHVGRRACYAASGSLERATIAFAMGWGRKAKRLDGTPAIDDVPSDWLDFTKASTNGPLAQGAALPGFQAVMQELQFPQ